MKTNSNKLRGGRESLLLDSAWEFHRGDITTPAAHDHNTTYHYAKACGRPGPGGTDYENDPGYNPSAWREVTLPHDWVVEEPYAQDANLNHGYRHRGIAWYRRKFRLDPRDEGKYLALDFDGVSSRCTVWVNGQRLHENGCGYTSFRVNISDVATFGDTLNCIAVRVDASEIEGWWYEGGGIYRHVRLVKTAPLHVAQWGVFARPVLSGANDWAVVIETSLENDSAAERRVSVRQRICDAEGNCIAQAEADVECPAYSVTPVVQNASLPDARRWSLEDPYRYRLVTEILVDGSVVDSEQTRFGCRTIRFDAETGFYLNEQPLKIKGTCNHQDHAGVGVALPDAIHEYRIRRLKELGANAYRCAHHPPAPELLDVCDRLGMLVMDENRHFNASPDGLEQLRSMVLRDRNHPSVFLWCIFNEEPIQGTPRGRKLAERMIACIKQLDSTRPVTAAMHGGINVPSGVMDAVDVAGINYNFREFDPLHARFPSKPVLATENNCAFSTRGVYSSDKGAQVFDSYDEQKASWGHTARETWSFIAARPWVAGYFVWTGFDYRGEPSPHKWPSVSSHWGILDTCGFAKDSYFLHQAFWRDEPILHILPHWNWPGREDTPIKVMVHTNCDAIELLLNGRRLYRESIELQKQACWMIPYETGKLEAIGYRAGREVCRTAVSTTGPAVALRMIPDRQGLAADNEDAMPVNICAIDAEGRVVPDACHCVHFGIEGPGRILGVGNGNPVCHEPDKAGFRSLFNGWCQLIVQAGTEAAALRLHATAEGLESAELSFFCHAALRRPFVPAVRGLRLLRVWQMSPVTRDRPSLSEAAADHDVNTWHRVEVGEKTPIGLAEDGFALLRHELNLSEPAGRRGRLSFAGVSGHAEFYCDGECLFSKASSEEAPVMFDLPELSSGRVTLSVLLSGEGAALTGSVTCDECIGEERDGQ